jgi:hypothetical protein
MMTCCGMDELQRLTQPRFPSRYKTLAFYAIVNRQAENCETCLSVLVSTLHVNDAVKFLTQDRITSVLAQVYHSNAI